MSTDFLASRKIFLKMLLSFVFNLFIEMHDSGCRLMLYFRRMPSAFLQKMQKQIEEFQHPGRPERFGWETSSVVFLWQVDIWFVAIFPKQSF